MLLGWLAWLSAAALANLPWVIAGGLFLLCALVIWPHDYREWRAERRRSRLADLPPEPVATPEPPASVAPAPPAPTAAPPRPAWPPVRAPAPRQWSPPGRNNDDGWWDRYNAYLETPQWQTLRLAVFKRDGYLCQHCHKARATDAHHLTYVRMGHEDLADLLSVCKSCHETIHGRSFN